MNVITRFTDCTSTRTAERTTARTGRRPVGFAVGAVATLAALTACGSDEPVASDSGDVATGDINVRAIDYAYLDLPDQMRAGSTLTLTNASEKEAHELVAIKLPDDETRSAAELVQLPPEELGAFLPEVRTVVLAGPADDGIAVVGDGSLTETGRYLIVCVIPTGADPAEYLEKAATSEGPPDVAGGPPHIAEGMFGEITVVD